MTTTPSDKVAKYSSSKLPTERSSFGLEHVTIVPRMQFLETMGSDGTRKITRHSVSIVKTPGVNFEFVSFDSRKQHKKLLSDLTGFVKLAHQRGFDLMLSMRAGSEHFAEERIESISVNADSFDLFYKELSLYKMTAEETFFAILIFQEGYYNSVRKIVEIVRKHSARWNTGVYRTPGGGVFNRFRKFVVGDADRRVVSTNPRDSYKYWNPVFSQWDDLTFNLLTSFENVPSVRSIVKWCESPEIRRVLNVLARSKRLADRGDGHLVISEVTDKYLKKFSDDDGQWQAWVFDLPINYPRFFKFLSDQRVDSTTDQVPGVYLFFSNLEERWGLYSDNSRVKQYFKNDFESRHFPLFLELLDAIAAFINSGENLELDEVSEMFMFYTRPSDFNSWPLYSRYLLLRLNELTDDPVESLRLMLDYFKTSESFVFADWERYLLDWESVKGLPITIAMDLAAESLE